MVNNTHFNQIQYLALTSILIKNGVISANDFADAYNKLDGIVYKDMVFIFKRMITENDALNFSCTIEHHLDKKDRDCFGVKLNLCEDAFEISGTAVCLNRSLHSSNGIT